MGVVIENNRLGRLRYDGRGLPRGRSSLPSVEVVDAQRQRLTQATIAVVAAEGYSNTSIGMIVKAARVSKGAFYQNFSGKEECFLAACLTGLHLMLISVGERLTDVRPGDDVGLLRASIDGFLRFLSEQPEFALCFAEMPGAGGEARRRFLGVIDLMATNTRVWHERVTEGEQPLSESVYRMASGGVAHLCLAYIHENRIMHLPELLDDLLDAHLRLLSIPRSM